MNVYPSRFFFVDLVYQSSDVMKLRRICLLSVLWLAFFIPHFLFAPGLLAQTNQDRVIQSETDSIPVQPFQAIEIPEAFNSSFSLINESAKKRLNEDLIESLKDQIDTLFSVIDLFLGDTIVQTLEGVLQ